MLIVILTVLGIAASIGVTYYQVDKQEQADAQTQAQITQIAEMQKNTMAQQKQILANQSRQTGTVKTAPPAAGPKTRPAGAAPAPAPAARPAAPGNGHESVIFLDKPLPPPP